MRHFILGGIAALALSGGAFAENQMAPAGETSAPAKEEAKAANVVEIEGTIVKVVAKKKEIYVKDAAGKKHEFYFKPHTKLTAAGAPAEFAALKEGLTVKVSAEKHGKRLDPLNVDIR